MSFCSDVKEDLSKINNYAKKELIKIELCGYLIGSNVSIIGKNVKFSTESEYNINRFAKVLKNCGIDNYKIDINGKKFFIQFRTDNNIEFCEFRNNQFFIGEYDSKELMDKALVRGVFLCGGYINAPEKKYHLSINLNNKINMDKIYDILKKYEINMKKLIGENSYALYIKEGEEISKFLAFIGASSSVLKFEEARVIRDTSNNLNRLLNCETANYTKTLQACNKQIEDIKFIKSKRKFSELPDNIKEVADIRLKYPEASLAELAKLMKNTISKSGISHRLATLSKFAEELRKG